MCKHIINTKFNGHANINVQVENKYVKKRNHPVNKMHKNNPTAQSYTQAIGKMIAVDMLPYNFVEAKGFRHVVDTMRPEYQIPSRKSFTNKIIPNIYEQTKKDVFDSLQKELEKLEGKTYKNFKFYMHYSTISHVS